MTRLYTWGAEVDPVNDLTPDIWSKNLSGATGIVAKDTSNQRSGLACYKFDSGASNVGCSIGTQGQGTAANRAYYCRAYEIFPALPGATANVLTCGIGSDFSVRLTSGGKLRLYNDLTGVQIGSDSVATLTTSVYYRIELGITLDATTGTTISAVELRLEGVTVASSSGLSVSASTQFSVGWILNLPGANTVFYADDIAVNDSQGSINNSWPGDGKIVLLKPTSDSQVGSWTGGAGGVTNLFDAVDNTPPVGTATETNTTQIESVDTSGDNATDEYRANCGSYSAASIGANDTINAIVVWCNHGEDVATGTKTGSFGLQANPSAAYQTFTFGADVGALGTYPTNWTWTSSLVEAPSVTKGSNLILAVRKTDTGTRVASVDALMAYVDYTPAAVTTPPLPTIAPVAAVQRAANW